MILLIFDASRALLCDDDVLSATVLLMTLTAVPRVHNLLLLLSRLLGLSPWTPLSLRAVREDDSLALGVRGLDTLIDLDLAPWMKEPRLLVS